MSSSRAVLRRRELLAALGASAFLGVPVFRQTLAEAQTIPPKRAIFFQWPDGVPSMCFQEGVCPSPMDLPDMAFFTFDGQLAPLAALKADTIVFKNMSFKAAEGGDPHTTGMRAMLTGAQGGTSLDQLLAKQLGQLTKFGSLQFGGSAWAGEPAQDRISFADGLALQQERDPVRMFNRLFAGFTAPATSGATPDPAVAVRNARDKSALDFLKTQITTLQGATSSAEKQLLDVHLESLRELEKQLTQVATAAGTACAAPDLGGVKEGQLTTNGGDLVDGLNTDPRPLAKLQLDLLYQAINCDLTRIATFQFSASVEVNATFDWIPGFTASPDQHHGFAHNHGDTLNEGIYKGIQTWFMEEMAGFVTRLKGTAEGTGSVLDNSIVMMASEMSNGNHTASPFPVVLAGRAGGAFQKMGQTVDANWVAHNDLLLAIAQGMGVPLTTIGNAGLCKGPLSI